ncbi:type VI secretion system baseplate subunit TssG [Piscinibacter sakaiensis]|uniref:type VI secretion system baseplate subunit TssG n=1 Tax=Piscinibacter sakaiensis TaxID=1547922 RepID=UPI003AABE3B2
MEAPDRPARDHLSLFRAIAEEPTAYGFFHATRLIECHFSDLPRIGTSRRLRDDPVRFSQEATLAFALSTVASLKFSDESPPRLSVCFTGLTGPNGPLPLHLTEFARDRLRNHGDRTILRFIDTFHHRIFGMFYRAWADAQPTVSLDRPDQDPFGDRLACLAGYGGPTMQERDAAPDFAKRAHTGLLANSVRNADGLARIIGNFFRVAARVEQWQPHWMVLPADSLTRLGGPAAQLGVTSVAGGKVWDCQSRFRIVLGPLGLEQFKRFLPGQDSLQRLKAWVRNYSGDELSCELQLLLRRPEVPAVVLGKAGQLGWTSWVGERPAAAHADDADELVLRIL